MNIFEKRLYAVKEMLKKEGVSSFLISNNIYCEYICGLRSSNLFLLIKEDIQYLLTDFRYRQIAKKTSSDRNFKFIELNSDGLGATLVDLLSSNESVGIESDNLTVEQFDKIEEKLVGINLKKISGKIAECVSCKSNDEIASMQKAASIGDKAFSQLLKRLHVGISESETSNILESLCRDGGSEGPSFSTIVLFGERSALPHGTPSDRKLKEGDFVLCDFGCTIKGYCSDMTRTIIFGRKNKEQENIYNIVNRARNEAINYAKAGISASSIDKIARDVIIESGYGEMFGHGTGHGVGREVHEFPAVNSRNDTILKDGMIITIEPGIYISDFGGVRIEDMVLVKEDGVQLLTGFTRDLIEIEEGSEI